MRSQDDSLAYLLNSTVCLIQTKLQLALLLHQTKTCFENKCQIKPALLLYFLSSVTTTGNTSKYKSLGNLYEQI